MLSRARSHLTYANVVSTLCLFIVLGGSAYAAATITGKNVKNRSLTGHDVKNNSLTGKQIRESRLGRVPNAAHLNGLRASSFLRVGGTAADASRLGGLDAGSFLRTGGTAADSAQLGGLGPGAFERRAQRFEIRDPTSSTGDEQTVTFGPFTLKPGCANNNEDAVISSSESHSAMGAVGGPNATAGDSADFSTSFATFLVALGSGPHVMPFELWAVAPSGYRLVVDGWMGRGVLGESCTVLGGVAFTG